MARRWRRITVTTVGAVLLLPGAGLAAKAHLSPVVSYRSAQCSAGAHTLAPPGSHLYPETGNGGYTSVHTLVHLVYDAATNEFLPGNGVVLTDRATQCLSSFSLDFERKSANTKAGPDMTVRSVTVNGRPATFTFVQPTYPGDPHGQNDPNPAAHEASQTNPVGGPKHNPLPPACSPELPNPGTAPNALDGTQCPANKLVITPAAPIANGSTFTVTVNADPLLIGAGGVITSLLAGHCVPLSELAGLVGKSSGEQAGGSGLCRGPPTGLVCDASCAAGLGSFCPCGSPG